MQIPIKRFDKNLPLPAGTEGAACFDLTARTSVTIPSKQIQPVPLNVALRVPEGHALLLFSRSSTPLRKGLMMANSVGVVDPFYDGDDDENMAFLYNFTDHDVTVEQGDRVVQGMIIRTEPVTWNEVDSMESDGHGGYQHLDELHARQRSA
ncbi:MAG TPA: hypothetical protein VJ841_01890 [Candidatus Saccharimonadales bacterium]|nr:hypothetical protein [Candidatus Saccharimonadales bacterium]